MNLVDCAIGWMPLAAVPWSRVGFRFTFRRMVVCFVYSTRAELVVV